MGILISLFSEYLLTCGQRSLRCLSSSREIPVGLETLLGFRAPCLDAQLPVSRLLSHTEKGNFLIMGVGTLSWGVNTKPQFRNRWTPFSNSQESCLSVQLDSGQCLRPSFPAEANDVGRLSLNLSFVHLFIRTFSRFLNIWMDSLWHTPGQTFQCPHYIGFSSFFSECWEDSFKEAGN